MSTHPFDRIERASLERPSSRKWSLAPGTVGAWVAEMDFGTAPAVREALHRAVRDDVLGYLSPALAADLSAATSEWLFDRYGWSVDPHRVHPVSDVMAALRVAVEHFSLPGSAVIVPTPAYMPFLTYPQTLGREVIEVPGRQVDGRWVHDLDGIDAAFRAGGHTLVLCNPHNPTGTVLTRAELQAIAEVVDRNDGRVFADEIHAPLRYDGRVHIPYASLSEETAAHTVTGTSASKAWNLPGLKAAQLVLTADADQDDYASFGFASVHGASTLGVIASTAAYRESRDWLDEVTQYLDGNRRLLDELVDEHLPGVRVATAEGTYLAWLDATDSLIPGSPADFFRERAGVTLTDGALCGHGSERFARLVFAMPRPLLSDAIGQMARALDQLAPA